MKKLFLVLCLIGFTGTAVFAAEHNYRRTSSPLSAGQTDKYFEDRNGWDSQNLYVPNEGNSGQNPNMLNNLPSPDEARKIMRANGGDVAQDVAKSSGGYVMTASDATSEVTESETKVGKKRTGSWRWNKNPSETYYNFGGTGFKSKGFGQGYTN